MPRRRRGLIPEPHQTTASRAAPSDTDPPPLAPHAAPSRVALVTGGVRDPAELAATLAALLRWRDEGAITAILFSTWRGQIEREAALGDLLARAGVEVLLSDAPEDTGPGNIYAQSKSAWIGLRHCPPDSLVLRLRTDKTLRLLPAFRPVLDRAPVPAGRLGAFAPPFRHKLGLEMGSTTALLWFTDFLFAGTRDDLLLTLDFSRRHELLFRHVEGSPELRFVASRFLSASAFLQQVYYAHSLYPLSHALFRWAHDGATTPLPRLAARLVALNAAVQATLFLGTRRRFDDTPAPEPISLARFLAGSPAHDVVPGRIAGFAATTAHSARGAQALLRDDADLGPSAAVLRAALDELRADGLGAFRYDPSEGEELDHFIDSWVEEPPLRQRLLRRQPAARPITPKQLPRRDDPPPAQLAEMVAVAALLQTLQAQGSPAEDAPALQPGLRAIVRAGTTTTPSLLGAAAAAAGARYLLGQSLPRRDEAGLALLALAAREREPGAQTLTLWHAAFHGPPEHRPAAATTAVEQARRYGDPILLALAAALLLEGRGVAFDPAQGLDLLRRALSNRHALLTPLAEDLARLDTAPPAPTPLRWALDGTATPASVAAALNLPGRFRWNDDAAAPPPQR